MITRVVTDSLIFGPFFNGPDITGVIGPEQLRAMTECGFNFLAVVRELYYTIIDNLFISYSHYTRVIQPHLIITFRS
jgi:hypothetical protein